MLKENVCDFFTLPFLFFKIFLFNRREEKKVRKLLYRNLDFKRVDEKLKRHYLFHNPYRICKNFMKAHGERSIHVYGETPLSELFSLFGELGISKDDSFLDLGSGRGRAVFLASTLFGCKAVGIDWVPVFCQKAQQVASSLSNPSRFLCQNLLATDEETLEADLIYFYAVCMSEEEIVFMTSRFQKLSLRTRIITVGFPLSDYSPFFYTSGSKKASYPWGRTELFVNAQYK